jgi:hypothetical protein
LHFVRSEPSHAFAAHTSPPPSAHGARVPRDPPLTGLHVPSLVATSHASHWPVHAESQQRPSTHRFDPHCAAPVHASPFGREQVPFFYPSPHDSPVAQTLCEQHTESTQKPLWHSLGSVHDAPSDSGEKSSTVVTLLP